MKSNRLANLLAQQERLEEMMRELVKLSEQLEPDERFPDLDIVADEEEDIL